MEGKITHTISVPSEYPWMDDLKKHLQLKLPDSLHAFVFVDSDSSSPSWISTETPARWKSVDGTSTTWGVSQIVGDFIRGKDA